MPSLTSSCCLLTGISKQGKARNAEDTVVVTVKQTSQQWPDSFAIKPDLFSPAEAERDFESFADVNPVLSQDDLCGKYD